MPEEKGFRYGDDNTIHSTGTIDVGVDENGKVTEVWFRCMNLPFKQFKARYDIKPSTNIKAIVFEESLKEIQNARQKD